MNSNPITRRSFLAALGIQVAAASAFGVHPASARTPPERALALYNAHTGESLRATYWARGRYLPGALREIDHLFRDFRTGDVHPIDRGLLDLLHTLHTALESRRPLELISGYRCPATNRRLAQRSRAVAPRSLHRLGMAADIRIQGTALAQLRDAALHLQRGGVGYYPDSGFVHVDVGRVRRW